MEAALSNLTAKYPEMREDKVAQLRIGQVSGKVGVAKTMQAALLHVEIVSAGELLKVCVCTPL